MYEIPTADFYKDIAPDVDQKFDTSNFEKDHISGIASVENKKEIGMMKDEAGGKPNNRICWFTIKALLL